MINNDVFVISFFSLLRYNRFLPFKETISEHPYRNVYTFLVLLQQTSYVIRYTVYFNVKCIVTPVELSNVVREKNDSSYAKTIEYVLYLYTKGGKIPLGISVSVIPSKSLYEVNIFQNFIFDDFCFTCFHRKDNGKRDVTRSMINVLLTQPSSFFWQEFSYTVYLKL